jgi:hypothetical protein
VEVIEEVLIAAGGRKAGGPPRQTGGMQAAIARYLSHPSHGPAPQLLVQRFDQQCFCTFDSSAMS